MNIFSQLVKVVIVGSALFAGQAYANNMCGQVWSGTIDRVRVQQQNDGTVVVRAYIAPGSNGEYAGYTSNGLMANTLIKGQDGMKEVTGYSDANCQIKWVDFK